MKADTLVKVILEHTKAYGAIPEICTGFQYGLAFALQYPEIAKKFHEEVLRHQIELIPTINELCNTEFNFVLEQLEANFITLNHKLVTELEL